MKSNISLIVIIFFLNCSSIKASQSKVFECEYLLELSNMLKTDVNNLALPVNVSVSYKVITNGLFYLVICQLTHANIGFSSVLSFDKEQADSMFYIKDKGVIYKISDKTYSFAETTIIDKSILKDTDQQYQKIDSTQFYIDPIYQKIINPFPQFSGNIFGIVKVSRKEGTCTIKSVKEIEFDFESIQNQVKNYAFSKDKIPLPF